MAFKTSSCIALLAALSGVVQAQDLCPPLNDIGHAESQQWIFNNLNYTLTKISSGTVWPPPENDLDESRVSFAIQSDFNAAPVQCTAEGAQFSEEYERQLAGKQPTYDWFDCKTDSADVRTQFKLVWWNTHLLNVRQYWTCPKTGRPMRATGQVTLNYLDCQYDSQGRRTHCAQSEGHDKPPITATIVEVLPPPTKRCAAASEATPDWTVKDFVWQYWNTTYPLIPPMVYANMTFRLVNEALNYSPRMNCTEPRLHGPLGGVYMTPYTCGVFEANEEDVPATRFDWVRDGTQLLRINQTWFCDDGPSGETRFQSIGDRDLTPLLQCKTIPLNTTQNGVPIGDTLTTCVTGSDFEIQGTLQ
ncbi:hypothetical protein F5B22DRAFT_643876 [Xylaria bambusicola]|uniref:uncharacterized protein n=1 Tax=Xylaria bambusicola TaxID=326684 RepID=UPI002008E2E2|nr:uncharacterized protein F5B22DRAFT_643876 [Xylaria bambusicola]KAI0521703.1 hypothetical protein F5B22DRAFT_643876 [Xylaria bambusicola]